MCGITGFLHFDSERKADPVILKKMTDTLIHRGPDGEGYFIHQNLAFGHRRLAILDLTTGDQPMFNSDKSLCIIFNGEIYNYLELRDELISLGRQFKTNSDTEVIIQSYEQWGTDCQTKFNGMWAFAIWDSRKNLLFISRDRVGEKPLYYSLFDNSFIFGSEIKSLLHYGIPTIPATELLEIYLSLSFIPAPFTFYKNIKELLPGHFLMVQNNSLKEIKYWDLPELDEENMLTSPKDIYQKFETLFRDSVKLRMRSDVPYGAFLSGGLDSSSVVAIMSELSNLPIETFTIGFKEKSFDESEMAQLVAEKFHTQHHNNIISPESFDSALEKTIFHYDQPFGDSSAIATGYVSKFAKEKVKMVLTGDGGDELLSGYSIYQGEKFASYYSQLPFIFRKTFSYIVTWAGSCLRGDLRHKYNRFANVLNYADLPFEKRIIDKANALKNADIKNILSTGKDILSIEEYIKNFMAECTYKDPFYKLLYFHFKLILPYEMLVKVDRMSMANSLETRLPFLDPRLIEFMVKVHKDIKLQGFERKSILRNTLGKKLPPQLLKQSKKGFGVPVREWFRNPSFQPHLEWLLDKNFLEFSKINKDQLQLLIKKGVNGEMDNGNFLWSLMVLRKWFENRSG